VLVRAAADPLPASAASRRLGAVHFEAGALVANDTITLSIDAVRDTVLGAPYRGRLWQAAPATARQQIAGRALGRVLAHEIGHYLMAWRGHAESGLMRASFDPHTLGHTHSDRLRVAEFLLPRLRARIAELVEQSKTRQARRIIRPLPEVSDGNPVEPAGVRPTQPTPLPAARSGG
jgi:hypothetical protein